MSERLPLHSVSIYIMPENKTPARRRQPDTASPEENFRHLQPQAPELEAAVLGSIMVEHDAYSLVSEILKPESFYEHRNQLVYTAIQTLMMEDEPVDMLTVTEQLKKNGQARQCGWAAIYY
jgi:replicative DNA helicase